MSFTFRPDWEGILGFGLLKRKFCTVPSGKFWARKLRPTKLNRTFLIINFSGPSLIFRIPLLNLQRSSNSSYKILEIVRKFKIFSFSRVLRIRFPFNFSPRALFFLWSICGGFLVLFSESLILDVIMKKYYEDPVDTAQDVIDRNLSVIVPHYAGSLVEILKNSPSNVTRTLAERAIVPKVIFSFFEKFHFNLKFS